MSSGLSSDSRTVDFALLTENISAIPDENVEDTANVIYLDPVSVTNDRFNVLFYNRTDGKYRINRSECSATELTLSQMTLDDVSFNLISSIVGFYEEDLGITSDNWEPSALLNLRKQLTGLDSLCCYCSTTSSLTRGELTNVIISEGGVVDGEVIHRLRLHLLFTNTNPDIEDVRVVVQYDVPLEFVPVEPTSCAC